jgi:hypothetical protein
MLKEHVEDSEKALEVTNGSKHYLLLERRRTIESCTDTLVDWEFIT